MQVEIACKVGKIALMKYQEEEKMTHKYLITTTKRGKFNNCMYLTQSHSRKNKNSLSIEEKFRENNLPFDLLVKESISRNFR